MIRVIAVALLLCMTSQQVSAQCAADFDLVFVVDSSGSIRVRSHMSDTRYGIEPACCSYRYNE